MPGRERGRSRDDWARAEHGGATEEMVGEGVEMLEGRWLTWLGAARSSLAG